MPTRAWHVFARSASSGRQHWLTSAEKTGRKLLTSQWQRSDNAKSRFRVFSSISIDNAPHYAEHLPLHAITQMGWATSTDKGGDFTGGATN